jgi:mRNA interferase HigB
MMGGGRRRVKVSATGDVVLTPSQIAKYDDGDATRRVESARLTPGAYFVIHIISKKKLRDFWGRYPKARAPLEVWYQVARHAEWTNFAEVRQSFNSADVVGRFVVFDVGGNKFRLITVIHFNRAKLFVRHVLTHAEYDEGKWKDD